MILINLIAFKIIYYCVEVYIVYTLKTNSKASDLSQKVQLNVQLLKSYYLNFPGSIKNKHTYKHLNLFFPNNL